MKLIPYPLAAVALLAACDGSQPIIFAGEEPVINDAEDVTEDETSGSDPASSAIPPSIDEILDEGTIEVDLSSAREDRGDIARTEARDGSGGFAEEFLINDSEDTLEIDNLAFDGLNVYTRGANYTPSPRLSDLGTIAIYHGDLTVPDFLTGEPVDQAVPYVALYDESDVIITDPIPADATAEEIAAIEAAARPRTSFAIVRTGDYFGFGFGGFGYERAGDSVLASTGQATFNGDYAGLRVLNQDPELLIVEADISIDIDFDDFNSGAGLKGDITNRQAYTAEGVEFPTFTGLNRTDIDLDDYTGLPEDFEEIDVVQLPNMSFVVRGGGETIKSNGEISGEIRSRYINPTSGSLEVYEDGSYFAIIAGDTTGGEDGTGDGGEIVGIVKVESPDSRFLGVTAQETGGFIAKR